MLRDVAPVAVAVIFTMGACGSPPSTVANADAGDLGRHIGIAPGGFTEVNLNMGAQDTVIATFQTDGEPLRWDVHSHPGEVVIHDEGVLWENQGSDGVVLTVRVDLTGSAEIASWITNP